MSSATRRACFCRAAEMPLGGCRALDRLALQTTILGKFLRPSGLVFRTGLILLASLVFLLILSQFVLAQEATTNARCNVYQDYATAYRAAEQLHGLLLVFFAQPDERDWFAKTARQLAENPTCSGNVHPVVVTIGDNVALGKRTVILSDQPAFASLGGQPGLALVSFLGKKDDPEYGRVTATFALAPTDWPKQERIVTSCIHTTITFYRSEELSEDKNEGVAAAVHQQSGSSQDSQVSPATFLSPNGQPPIWLSDYESAIKNAKEGKKMLLVYVAPEDRDTAVRDFERRVLMDPQVMTALFEYVCVRIPESFTLLEDAKSVRILDHSSLVEMEHQPGFFIVDYASDGADYYGQVVSVFPFLDGRTYSTAQMLAILSLPPGTLTQRTMIYAVRTHPERPRSILGRPDPFLLQEAENHSAYQARIRRQGHHFWETRFHRIISFLRRENTASEVCAEGWPGQGLLRAALDCVRSWRHSSGHWRAVSSYQDAYGYDIKKGSNGIWYATGVFASRQ